jgi:Tol biopolymer transport system component
MIVAMNVGGNWDLYLGDESHDAPQRRLIKSSAADNGPMLSADRRTVIYMHDTDVTDNRRTLRVAGAADGKGDRELFSSVPGVCNAKMYRPALSPTDPGLLAVPCTNKKRHWGLYLIRTDGRVVREIEQPGKAVDDPTFSPDGKELAFWSGGHPDGGNLYITRVDKPSPPRPLTKSQLAGQDGDPMFSPSGDSIVFRRRTADGTTGGNADIYVIRADGKGGARRLTNDPATERDPSYSPSGKRIAFQSNKWTPFWPNAKVTRVWIMNKDGTNQRLLWTQQAVDRQATPAWSGR